MNNVETHSIPYSFVQKRFQSNYPLNFENRINRQHFKSFLQNCSKIVRRCCREIDSLDRLMKYTAIVYVTIMVFIIIASIIVVLVLSLWVEWIYPFIVFVLVALVPTIGVGFAIYQRGKKIKDFHLKCQIALENYIMQENRQTIPIGIQWTSNYNADLINIYSPYFAQSKFLMRIPRIDISDRESQFSFEIIPDGEVLNDNDDDNDDNLYQDDVHLLNHDDN